MGGTDCGQGALQGLPLGLGGIAQKAQRNVHLVRRRPTDGVALLCRAKKPSQALLLAVDQRVACSWNRNGNKRAHELVAALRALVLTA